MEKSLGKVEGPMEVMLAVTIWQSLDDEAKFAWLVLLLVSSLIFSALLIWDGVKRE